jgi:rhomboid protease GluP
MIAAADDTVDEQSPLVITDDMLANDEGLERIDFEYKMRLFPPATAALVALCVAVFVWQIASGGLGDADSLVEGGALIREGLLRGEVWRLTSSMFLHADLTHLVGNMIPLFILGMGCEHAFGAPKTTAIFLAAGVAGGLATVAIDPRPTVGASGAVFGLMGCLVAVLVRLRRRIRVRDGRIASVLALWALWQIVLGFTSPVIANFAHIGGLVAGGLLGLLVPSRLRTATFAQLESN